MSAVRSLWSVHVSSRFSPSEASAKTEYTTNVPPPQDIFWEIWKKIKNFFQTPAKNIFPPYNGGNFSRSPKLQNFIHKPFYISLRLLKIAAM